MRLSLALGIPVDEMLKRIDSRTIAEYMALEREAPFTHVRGDVQAAVIASTIANVNRAKGGRAFTVQDFLPFAGTEQQSQDDIRTQLMQLVGLTGDEAAN